MDETREIENSSEQEIERPLYCFFRRGGRNYYLPVDALREVVEIKEVFPIPLAPDYIKGAIPLRGVVVPVIDLAKIYNTEVSDEEPGMLIVVEAMKEEIGFLSEGLPGFAGSDETAPEEALIEINKFFETYMIKENI
ncbi:MAG: chemotaxis protein CheW [Thermodesulfovibrionales bacterium]